MKVKPSQTRMTFELSWLGPMVESESTQVVGRFDLTSDEGQSESTRVEGHVEPVQAEGQVKPTQVDG